MKIGQTGDAIYPEIYPDLVESYDFIVGLFPVQVKKDKTGEVYTYVDYLMNHQRTALHEYPFVWLSWLKEKLVPEDSTGAAHKTDVFRLTKKEFGIANTIGTKLNCNVDKKTNVITIVVEDQDPLIAATMADSVKSHLQNAITDYRTKKARIDLEYMEGLFSDAKEQYAKARKAYAAYADANQNSILEQYRQKELELENELQLKYSIYQQVVEQMQLAKAKVQEQTPAFTTIQSASVPIKHSSRPKIVTLVIWMFLGAMIRLSVLAWKNRKLIVNL